MKLEITQQQEMIKELFDFFNNPDERLTLLVQSEHSYSHFYKEYSRKPSLRLDIQTFELLISKSSYKQVALALNYILFKCEKPTEIELLENYSDEILTIFSLNLWFNNFEYGINEIFNEFPEFKKEFDSKVEKRAVNMVSTSSMWELFLTGDYNLQEKILNVAIRENLKHISGSLDMSKKIAKMKG
jgi:hypothetical protein